jgi:hypothetical protein
MLTTDTDCTAAIVRDLVLSKIYAGPRYGFRKKLFEKTSEYLAFLFANLFCLIEWMKLGRFIKRNGFFKGGQMRKEEAPSTRPLFPSFPLS